jgi:4-hydroxybenzoate polyprenyltransferase
VSNSPDNEAIHGKSGDESPHSKGQAYLELVRLPNVFTALADVTMGFLFTHEAFGPRDGWVLGLLLAASGMLYAAGVTLNDVFDREVDARERPGRPIPSGRVSLAAAKRLGWGFLETGAAMAWLAAVVAGVRRPAVVGLLLAGMIVFYNRIHLPKPGGCSPRALERLFAPLAMGACRMLNVLLGMSVQPIPWRGEHWLVAGAIGIYIVGVTLLAKNENRENSPWHVALAAIVILAGIGLLVPLPWLAEDLIPTLIVEPYRWYLLLGILGGLTALRLLQVVFEPYPEQLQVTVKHCILSLVIFDAAACYVVRDIAGAIAVAVFLVPATILGLWIYST